jgi:Flp pilus assembly protein TadD
MAERLTTQYHYAGISSLQVLLTWPRVFFSYLQMMLAPFPHFMEFIRSEPISRSLLQPPSTFLALLGMLLLVITAMILVRKKPLITFGTIFSILVVMPESLLIPHYLFFGYRAILPMIGLMMVVGYFLMTLLVRIQSQSRTWPVSFSAAALICILFCVAGLSLGQANKWNSLQFWRSPADKLPSYSAGLDQAPYLDIVTNGAYELIKAGKYVEAVDLFGKACGISPETPNALSKVIGRHDNASGFQTAADDLIKNFSGKNDRIASAFVNAASGLSALGDNGAAELFLKKAIEIQPNMIDAYFSLAELYVSQDRLASGWHYMQRASAMAPSDPRFLNGLGKILVQQGKGSDAVPYFEKAIEAAPHLDEAYHNLGEAYVSAKMFQEAELRFRKALQLNGKNWKAHNSLGLLLAQSGNTADAMSHFQTALSLSPRNWRIYNNLGVMLAKSGDHRNAAIQFQKALEINPQDLSAKANLARLRNLLGSPSLK